MTSFGAEHMKAAAAMLAPDHSPHPWHVRLGGYRVDVPITETIPQALADGWTAVMQEAVEVWADPEGHFQPDLEFIDLHDDEMVDKRIAGYQCVVLGTRVLTADLQWVSAELLKAGDHVLSFDEYALPGQYRHWRLGTVLNTKIIELPSSQITLSDGTVLTAADNHPWFVGEHDYVWRETRALKVGNHLPKLLSVWDEDISYGAGWLAGMADGEGTISQEFRTGNPLEIAIYQNKGPVLDRVVEELQRRGFSSTVHDRNDSNTKMLVILGGKSEGLRFLGAIRPIRLLSKLALDVLGAIKSHTREHAVVSSIRSVGIQPVVALRLDTSTYLAEGYGAHNSGYDKEWVRREVGGYWHDFREEEYQEKERYIFADMPLHLKRALVSRWDALHYEYMDDHPEACYDKDFGYYWRIEEDGVVVRVKMWPGADKGKCPDKQFAEDWEKAGLPGGLYGYAGRLVTGEVADLWRFVEGVEPPDLHVKGQEESWSG